jgi:hypothetical protein
MLLDVAFYLRSLSKGEDFKLFIQEASLKSSPKERT